MKKLFVFVLCVSFFACKNEKPAEEQTETMPADTVVPQSEFADAKYTEMGKQNQAAFERGDVSVWMNNFADNAVYVWNNGDSISGKAAITEYWTKRREIIDSISFSNQVWLPIKVNHPQGVEAPGNWLLNWYQVYARYKTTGKSMTQWMHALTHYDANDKIDRVIQFSDRALINAALTK